MGEYRIAQICLKGHVVTEDISNPELLEDFCSKCGSQTITACPSCSAPIRGEYFAREFISLSEYELPKYCYKCGKPYPWTQKAIDDAAALIEEMSTLETAEKDTFKAAVSDVMFESSSVSLSAVRISKYLRKVSAPLQEAFKHTLYGVAVEAAKRIIWPV